MGFLEDFRKRKQTAKYITPKNLQAILDNSPVGSVGAPGGMLTNEVPPERRDVLEALLAGGSMLPGPAGDVLGPIADAHMYYNDPSSRTWGNYALTGLGMLPFVPSLAAPIHAVHGTFQDVLSDWWQGTHFGYPQAALERLKHTSMDSTPEGLLEGGARVYPVELDDSKVLKVSDRQANYYEDLLNRMEHMYNSEQERIFPREEIDNLWAEANSIYNRTGDRPQALRPVLEALKEKGYTLLEYMNEFEDKGNTSWVLVNPNAVKSYFGEMMKNKPDSIKKAFGPDYDEYGRYLGNEELLNYFNLDEDTTLDDIIDELWDSKL